MLTIFKSMFANPMLSVSAQEAFTMIERGVRVFDVREANEFSGGSLANAINVPLSKIEREGVEAIELTNLNKDEKILFVCRSGARSGTACAKLKSALGDRAINIEGGIGAWLGAGFSVSAKN